MRHSCGFWWWLQQIMRPRHGCYYHCYCSVFQVTSRSFWREASPNRDAWPTPINSSCWLGNPIAWFCSGQIDHCGANWAKTSSLTSLWVPTPHKLQQRFKDFSGPNYPICEDWRATLVKCNFISVTIDSNVDVVSTKITESHNRDSICILIHHDVHRLAPIQFCTLVNKPLNLRQAVWMRPTRVDIF